MIHARKDYNRIQDPENKIPEDELVFLLRGQDEFAPKAIKHWAECVKRHANGNLHGREKINAIEMANTAELHAVKMEEDHRTGGGKFPDL